MNLKPLCRANIDVLKQLENLILCTAPFYQAKTGGQTSGIGKHIRHVLDHYRAFQNGLPNLIIDYNQRQRNCSEERQPQAAIETALKLTHWLNQITIEPCSVTVISEISLHQTESMQMQSTVERELVYLINHAIHHMAYASVLATSKGLSVPESIGLAPNTASYERQQRSGGQ